MKKYFGILAILLCSPAQAFDLSSSLVPPKFQKIFLNYTGVFYGGAENDPDDLSANFQNFSAVLPVYKNEERAFSFTAASSQLSLSPARSNIKNLTDSRFGFSYSQKVDDKRFWSFSAHYGSASDKPFENNSVNTLSATGFYLVPRNESSHWLFGFNYSNNRSFLNNIPLPLVGLSYTPHKNFRAVYGLPFVTIFNRFNEYWSTDFMTLIPIIFKGAINYHVTSFAQIYAGYSMGPETWYLHDRTNQRDRLFYDEKRLYIGFKSPIARFLMGELEGGQAFDRRFFVDENYSYAPKQSATVGNAYYLKLSLRAFF